MPESEEDRSIGVLGRKEKIGNVGGKEVDGGKMYCDLQGTGARS